MSESSTPPTSPPIEHARMRTAAAPALPLAPLTGGQRLIQIDFLRGIALFGILMVNAAFFFRPFGEALDTSWTGDASTADRLAWSVVDGFFSFKFISLFSMMFGYGVALQMHRVDDAHRSKIGFAIRRFGMLLFFGACHGVLIWHGDILFLYGLMGFILAACARVPGKVLLIVAAIIAGLVALLALTKLGMSLVFTDFFAGAFPDTPATSEQLEQARGFDAVRDSGFFNFGSDIWRAAETRAMTEGPAGDAIVIRAFDWGLSLFAAPFDYGWHVLSMMLFGMSAYKLGFWEPQRAALRKRIAIAALSVGLLFSLGGVALIWLTDFRSNWAWSVNGFTMEMGALILPAGYAVVIAGAASRVPRFVSRTVAAAGRMPLSVYLMESICATTLSYWWGFGWFGKVGAAEQVLIVICIWTSLIIVARVWLAIFAMGPMEWLWRSVTYLTLHPARATSR